MQTSVSVFKFVLYLVLTPWKYADSSTNRQHYRGKFLNIAPKECTSHKYPGLVGICMISLECQQRSGTVIGACRDGHLFGACCSDAADFPTASPLEFDSTTAIAIPQVENFVKPFKIPQGLLDLAVFNIASDTVGHLESEVRTHDITVPPTFPTTIAHLPPTTQALTTTEAPTTTHAPTHATTTTQTSTTTHAPTHAATKTQPPTTTHAKATTRTTYSPNTTKVPATLKKPAGVIISPTESVKAIDIQTTTSKPTKLPKTTPSSTTKFVYGKLKYSPRPMKLRSTTSKTVWTRPPTTEASYSIFSSSNEYDDDIEEENEISKLQMQPHTITVLTSTSASTTDSVESSTAPVAQTSPQSIEEVATTIISTTNETYPHAFPARQTATPIEAPTLRTDKAIIDATFSTTEPSSTTSRKVIIPVKNSRLSNEIDEDNSNSDGWDNKLNEFVNQVVEGIAEELDKSNIDEVVFKARPTQKTTTTAPAPKKKSKPTLKSKHTSKSKSSSSNKKEKVTITKQPPTKKPKHSKKKVSPPESVEIERDVLDYREVCGVRPLARRSRIVGGNPSIHGNWPWHVLVKETVWWGIFSKVKCGGVLIGPQHVLTAAHCQPQQTGTLSVVLGVTDSDNPSSHAVTKGVRRIIRHPQFNPRSYENDIAILELDSPVQFQPHIVPICLPDLKETFVGKKGFVTGMGLLKHDGERPSMLYEVDVPILNNTDCQKMFRKSGNMKPIKPSFICAGYRHGRKDSCGGDSGGPLSVKRNNGQWVLAGTVSHGIKCAVPNQPGIYMRTTWYLPWIEKVIRSVRMDLPKCHGPPPICERPQARSGGLMDTIFRIFRLARRLWKSRK